MGMSTYRLSNVLAPRSLALVGASPRQGSLGAAILKNITEGGFAGQIGLVNPRHDEIAGVKTVSHIDKLPFGPELVVVTAPAREVPDIIDAAGGRGAGGAGHMTGRPSPAHGAHA
jgi:acetyltransferase